MGRVCAVCQHAALSPANDCRGCSHTSLQTVVPLLPLRTLQPASTPPAAAAQHPAAGSAPPLAGVLPPLAPLFPAPPMASLCSPPQGFLNSQNSLNLAGGWSLQTCPRLLAQTLLQLQKKQTENTCIKCIFKLRITKAPISTKCLSSGLMMINGLTVSQQFRGIQDLGALLRVGDV